MIVVDTFPDLIMLSLPKCFEHSLMLALTFTITSIASYYYCSIMVSGVCASLRCLSSLQGPKSQGQSLKPFAGFMMWSISSFAIIWVDRI